MMIRQLMVSSKAKNDIHSLLYHDDNAMTISNEFQITSESLRHLYSKFPSQTFIRMIMSHKINSGACNYTVRILIVLHQHINVIFLIVFIVFWWRRIKVLFNFFYNYSVFINFFKLNHPSLTHSLQRLSFIIKKKIRTLDFAVLLIVFMVL